MYINPYSRIFNPATGRTVNVMSKVGKNVLKGYINELQGGYDQDNDYQDYYDDENYDESQLGGYDDQDYDNLEGDNYYFNNYQEGGLSRGDLEEKISDDRTSGNQFGNRDLLEMAEEAIKEWYREQKDKNMGIEKFNKWIERQKSKITEQHVAHAWGNGGGQKAKDPQTSAANAASKELERQRERARRLRAERDRKIYGNNWIQRGSAPSNGW